MTLELYHNTELGAVIDRNKDTRYIPICIAIRVFHIAIYRNTSQYAFWRIVAPLRECILLYRTQSSANRQTEDLMLSGRLFMKMRNRTGPRTNPWAHQIALGLDLRLSDSVA